MVQVPDVDNVGAGPGQGWLRKGIIHRRVAVTVSRPGHVDYVKSDSSVSRVGFLLNGSIPEGRRSPAW